MHSNFCQLCRFDLLEFRNITADVEVIPVQTDNEAYGRLVRSNVKYLLSPLTDRHLSQVRDVAQRRRAKHAAVFAAELRRAFIANQKGGIRRIHAFCQH